MAGAKVELGREESAGDEPGAREESADWSNGADMIRWLYKYKRTSTKLINIENSIGIAKAMANFVKPNQATPDFQDIFP